MHPGWTRRLTRAAIETTEHVLDEGIRDFGTALIERPHHVNAAARRVHFAAQHAIRRARGQTKTAMNAIEIKLIGFVRHRRAVPDSFCLRDRRRNESGTARRWRTK